jgi:hypothetical protein
LPRTVYDAIKIGPVFSSPRGAFDIALSIDSHSQSMPTNCS